MNPYNFKDDLRPRILEACKITLPQWAGKTEFVNVNFLSEDGRQGVALCKWISVDREWIMDEYEFNHVRYYLDMPMIMAGGRYNRTVSARENEPLTCVALDITEE
jgi:hypothetical protein